MMWNNKDFDKNAAVYEAVQKFTASKDGEGIKIGELKFRHSKTTNQSYLSHGCYYCDALFGDFFVSEEKLHNYYDTTNIRHNAIVNIDDYSESDSHWCYSEIGDFCEK